MEGVTTFRALAPSGLLKASKQLGIVFGYAIVSKVDGEDYYDLQGDNIDEEAMTKAASEFALEVGKGKIMHTGPLAADVVFLFPLTTEIAKALDITAKRHGLLVGFKPHDPAVLDKFASGEFTGFSIGGTRGDDEVVEP